MAILAALFALGSRFVGKILTTALGWASTMLFGRVPANRQMLLLGITFGSVIWVVLLVGVLLPDVGTFLLVLIPQQDVVPETAVRLVMLALALTAPALIGGLTLLLTPGKDRTARTITSAVLRGYPLTALLAVLLIFLAALAIVRKAISLRRGWTDAHVPLVVQPGRYEAVARDLDSAVSAVGLDVEPQLAPGYLAMPARWLAGVAGTSAASLVPDRMIRLRGIDIDILIYSMDLLISGKPRAVARARAAMASRLTTSAAHLTVSAEAQAIEDRLAALAKPADHDDGRPPRPRPFDDATLADFEAIDHQLATMVIPCEEWEVLYRQRLQVERDLRAGAMAGEAVLGAATPGPAPSGLIGTLEELGRLARSAAEAALELAADERTGQVIRKVAPPQVRLAARLAAIGATATRAVIRARRGDHAATAMDGSAIPDAPPGSPAPRDDPHTRSASRAG